MDSRRTVRIALTLAAVLAGRLAVAQDQSASPTPEPAATTAPAATPEATGATPAPAATEAPAASPTPADAAEPDRGTAPISAEDILKEFQRERPVAEPLLPQSKDGEKLGGAAGGESAGDSGRLPDGYMLIDRTCRLVRDGDWWVLTFLADNHPEAAPEPPMKLLPNRMLERMVRESESSTDSVEFIVSGEVTDFMGENYLLLRKLMRKRELGNLTH